MNTEHADLLGFKTGLKMVEHKEKKPREDFKKYDKKEKDDKKKEEPAQGAEGAADKEKTAAE